MTLETFFEKFDQFADAPDAVAKMRELVLDLAVQGKLVAPSPNPDKHPAWLAFRKEVSERVYSYDPGPPPPFEIPDHWEWCVLDEVADCRAAAKVSPAAIRDTDWVLDLEDIDGTTGQIIQTATFAERRSLSTKAAFEPGDVLYGKLRPYLNKVVVAAKRGFCTTEIIPLRPAPFLTPEFLRFYLRSQTFLCYAAQKNYGMKMPRLGTKDLESAEIPVPPPAEQKRIVAKVDELMAMCDRLAVQQQEREKRHAALARASLARFADAPTPANLNLIFHPSYSVAPADLRKSILTLAVQGKLVPQDPNDEPAEDTLAKALRARERQEKSLRIKEPIPVEADAEHMPDLPCGWCYSSPDQLTAFHKNALTIGPFGSSLLKSDYTDEGVPLVFVRDIRSESFGGPETRFVTPGKAEELASHTVRPGDLLITKMGDPPGDTAIYPDGRPPAIITADCIKLTPHRDVVSAEYLLFTIRASQIAEQFAGITLGVAQQKVSLGRFRCIAVPLPPLAEQRRIVAKVEQLMALVDALETQLTASRATAANLLSALVAELTGTPNDGKVSIPSASTTGRRGRPRKSP